MARDIRVLIVEDDPYAQDFMMMLLTRDWRTKVVGVASNHKELKELVTRKDLMIDLVLLDSETPHRMNWLTKSIHVIRNMLPDCLILCLGNKPDRTIMKQLVELECNGYLIKSEIKYGLASAIQQVVSGRWVVTESVENSASAFELQLPDRKFLLTYSNDFYDLTTRESQVLKLFVLFNLGQKDIADEFKLKDSQQIGQYMGRCYGKIGLNDILDGHTMPTDILDHDMLVQKFQDAQLAQQNSSSIAEKSTLAFHLLTCTDR